MNDVNSIVSRTGSGNLKDEKMDLPKNFKIGLCLQLNAKISPVPRSSFSKKSDLFGKERFLFQILVKFVKRLIFVQKTSTI